MAHHTNVSHIDVITERRRLPGQPNHVSRPVRVRDPHDGPDGPETGDHRPQAQLLPPAKVPVAPGALEDHGLAAGAGAAAAVVAAAAVEVDVEGGAVVHSEVGFSAKSVF